MVVVEWPSREDNSEADPYNFTITFKNFQATVGGEEYWRGSYNLLVFLCSKSIMIFPWKKISYVGKCFKDFINPQFKNLWNISLFKKSFKLVSMKYPKSFKSIVAIFQWSKSKIVKSEIFTKWDSHNISLLTKLQS